MFVFFKQKTAYEMRISDWSSDVCSSDLPIAASVPSGVAIKVVATAILKLLPKACAHCGDSAITLYQRSDSPFSGKTRKVPELSDSGTTARIGSTRKAKTSVQKPMSKTRPTRWEAERYVRSEEHPSELQSPMRSSNA